MIRNIYYSVSPAKYYHDFMGNRVKLSTKKTMQDYSVPKGDRGLLKLKKVEGPNPCSYENSQDLMKKHSLINHGSVGLPKQTRDIDFRKYSSIHEELVEKGIY